MNLQTKACYKKEWLAFLRTKRFFILIIIFIGWATLEPLMVRGLGVALETLAPVYEEMGMDVTQMTEMIAMSASTGVILAINSINTVGLISFLLLINSFAGGEQKKRSIMIPKTSGLKNTAYLMPKYIIYPLSALILAVVAAFVAWGVSALVFDINDVSVQGIFFGGILAGVSLMFYVCIHITIGTATGRPGMSAVICIVASIIVPGLFAILGAELIYNPFGLSLNAATAAISGSLMVQDAVAVIIAVVMMAILYLVALFALNTKKVDNSGNEIMI